MAWFFIFRDWLLKLFVNKLSSYGFEKKHILLTYLIVFSFLFFILNQEQIILVPKMIAYLFAIFGPFVLTKMSWELWQTYLQAKFLKSQKPVLLEIIFPDKFMKTPKAMESFLSSIHINPGESTVTSTHLQGSIRPYWSLELISVEGELHFYIWTWQKMRNFIETQFYAVYPDVKLVETEDYMNGIHADLDKISLWGTDYKFTKNDVYPIKSYVDWGLDKINSSKNNENIIDPFDSILEKFSSLGEGEVAILHIMFQMTRNKNWQKDVEKEIDKIYKNRAQEITDLANPEKTIEGYAQLRPQDYEIVNTLKHSMEKDAFDVGIRSLYIARKDKFQPATRIGSNHVHMFRAFEVPHLNYLIGTAHWLAGYDYPWHDKKQKIQNVLRHNIIDAMRRRSYFHTPYAFDPLILTTEELATIYHIPLNLNKRQRFGPTTNTKTIPKNLPI